VSKDCGHYPLSQQTTVVIYIVDVNDNAPVIKRHQLSSSSVSGLARPDNEVEVSEHASPGTFLAHLSVHDRDSADNGRFSCFLNGFDVGGIFALRRFHHGEYAVMVSGGRRLDHERRRRYDVTVTCADHGQPSDDYGQPSAVSSLAISVTVVDENDSAPEFPVNPVVTSRTTSSCGVFSVVTSLVENNRVGAVVAVVSAVDRDRGVNGRVKYSLEPAIIARWVAVDRGSLGGRGSYLAGWPWTGCLGQSRRRRRLTASKLPRLSSTLLPSMEVGFHAVPGRTSASQFKTKMMKYSNLLVLVDSDRHLTSNMRDVTRHV